MRLSGLLTRRQVEEVHRNALKVLAQVGVRVEHDELRKRLGAVGGRSDGAAVRFAPEAVERLISDAPKHPRRPEPPTVSLGCGIYLCRYLDPQTGELRDFDEELLARYVGLAESLAIGAGILGLPFVPEGFDPRTIPLLEKLYAWKYGASPGGSVHLTELCEPLLEIFQTRADATGKRIEEVFCAAGWMISPLKLSRPECEQLLFFADRGLRMFIGSQPTQGASAPVTFGGSLVLGLAEQIFLFLLNHALWGDVEFEVGGTVSAIDMRTAAQVYGRPEQARIILAFADMAEFYGCSCSGHTGCTDAHLPSYEAGVQKAVGALMTALAMGHASIEAGLLGVDEICSPVQMVLDHDLAGSLRALLSEASISEDECALDQILAVGPGGGFLDTEFTAERFRNALFDPKTWSNQSLSAWRASGMKVDVDRACDIVADFEREFRCRSRISDGEEKELRAIIRRAAGA